MKIFEGVVKEVKMNKTVTVLVENMSMHRLYGKRFIRSKKYHVHDDIGCKVGDTVSFVASKPFSKEIKWNVLKVGGRKNLVKIVVGEKKITKKNLDKRSKKI
jgi:small subunit ribosomal protein S17